MMASLRQLSSFTGNHSQHDPEWTIPGSRPQSLFCLACTVETFEGPNSEVPVVRKKHLLGELLKAINSHEKLLLDLLAEDNRVAWHLTQTVYSILEVSNETLSAIVIEVLVQLCCTLKSEELVCCLVHQISTQVQQAGTFSTSLPALTLLGRLLHSIPALVQTVNQNEEPLITYVLTGLTYPDENVKSSCAFILAHVVPSPVEGSRQVCRSQISELAGSVLPLLATAQSNELRINAMGLLKKLLEHEDLTRTLMKYQGKTGLASILKKMLLSRDDTLLVTSVQCAAQVLLHRKTQPSDCQYAEELLNGDVAEFLYEALATTNGLLLSSTFCCLLLFTEIDSFFSMCHTVYGIESLVRAVQQSAKLNNSEALNYGLQLLSEIFKKQPEDIQLMNNETTLTQLCSLLTDCMTHTEITTVIHATQTLADLLRRDHLPSPVHFKPLVTTLQALVDSLQRLPKPLVGNGHRSHNRHSHRGQSRQTPSKQELLISGGLRTMQRAVRLAAACLNDPSTTESQFRAPDSLEPDSKTQSSGLGSLIKFLLQAVDETCIPIVMINVDGISLPDIFTSLFGMLCVAMEYGLADTNTFSIKLASSSFIQLALTIKNKFLTQDRQLHDVINSFLSELCASLQDSSRTSEDQQALRDTLHQALPQIHGSASEMIHLLYELPPSTSSSNSLVGRDDMDRNLQLKQQACLALLYYAFLHNDKLAPESAIHEAVVSFLANQPNLKKLPESTSRHLLLLLATCHGNGHEQSVHTGVRSFLKVLEDGDMSGIYTHHHCIIDWCFGPSCQRSGFAQRILEQWLLHSSCSDNSDRTNTWENGGGKKTMSALLKMNPVCFEMILDIVSSGSDQLVHESLSLLECIFCTDASSDEDSMEVMLQVLRRRVPDIVQRIFMSKDHQPPADVHIVALLRLTCTVHKRCPQNELKAVDVKLMYHVTNLISKHTSSNPDILQAALNYLTCLLIQAASHGETRVVSVILSNVPTLQFLEGLLSTDSLSQQSPIQCCCLSIMAQLIICQAKFNIKVQHTMSLDLSFALELLRSNKHILRKVCGLQVWTALFNTKFESPVLRLVNKSAPRALQQEEHMGLSIQAGNMKSIYTWLQESIAKDDPFLGQAAVTCMRSVITYLLEKCEDLATHLLAHPWNPELMSHCFESRLDSGHIPAYVIQLFTLFLQRGSKENMVTIQHLEGVADYIQSVGALCYTNQQSFCDVLMLAQQVIVHSDVQLTIKVVLGLHKFLQQVTSDPTKYQSLDRQDDVIYVSSVILQHPDSFSANPTTSSKAKQMIALARDLFEKLDCNV